MRRLRGIDVVDLDLEDVEVLLDEDLKAESDAEHWEWNQDDDRF